jgi:hypothetical protein
MNISDKILNAVRRKKHWKSFVKRFWRWKNLKYLCKRIK